MEGPASVVGNVAVSDIAGGYGGANGVTSPGYNGAAWGIGVSVGTRVGGALIADLTSAEGPGTLTTGSLYGIRSSGGGVLSVHVRVTRFDASGTCAALAGGVSASFSTFHDLDGCIVGESPISNSVVSGVDHCAGVFGGQLSHSVVHDCDLGNGWTNGVIQADPQFLDPSGDLLAVQPLSPAVDAGDPDSDLYCKEPPNNGCRVNAGAWGGTAMAAHSPTATDCPCN